MDVTNSGTLRIHRGRADTWSGAILTLGATGRGNLAPRNSQRQSDSLLIFPVCVARRWCFDRQSFGARDRNDTTIAVAGQSGDLQLNVMLPVVAYDLLQSLVLLTPRMPAARVNRSKK